MKRSTTCVSFRRSAAYPLMTKCHTMQLQMALNVICCLLFSPSDFAMICEEAAKPKNQLEKVNVLIERAPVCKSIFVRGIPENTPREEFENYFDKFGVVEKFITNEEEVKARTVNEKRAIVYFKTDKST